jgi:hypothetical protein
MKSKKPSSARARRGPASSSGRTLDQGRAVILDFVQSRIEAFNAEQGGGVAVRKDAHGYTLLHQDSSMPIARLRPRGTRDQFEVLYWSPFRERWLPVGSLGMVLSLHDALEYVANDPMNCFWR